jgi:photosystem II stability/assembly factor-like uncharacterized protein
MAKKITVAFLLIVSLCILQIYVFADSNDLQQKKGILWTKKPILASGTQYSITYGNKLYVSVGEAGTIKVSTNKTDWTMVRSNTTNNLYSVVWNGKQYIAVGSKGTILTSDDGYRWLERTSDVKSDLRCVTWGNDQFVIGADKGAILFSKDGIEWKSYFAPIASNIYGITWGEGKYIAVGEKGAIFSSTDGINWSTKPTDIPYSLKSVTHNGYFFVAVGNNKEYSIQTSSDGETWSKIYTGNIHILHSVVWDGTRFLAIGDRYIMESVNGITWKDISPSHEFTGIYSIAWDGSEYCASGENGVIATSKDCISWRQVVLNKHGAYTSIAWNGKEFVVVQFGNDEILRSPDGDMWFDSHTGGIDYGLIDILWDGKNFIALGQDGKILTSPDGMVWESRETNTQRYLSSIAYSGQQYVVVGDSGTILYSLDGLNWENVSQQEDMHFRCVTFGNNRFIACGQDGLIMTSENGLVWTRIDANKDFTMNDIVWNGKQFLIVGNYGIVLISSDGLTWTESYANFRYIPSSIIWDGNRYMAVGDRGLISTSADGISWTIIGGITDNNLSDIISYDGKYMVVGSEGTILTGRYASSDTQITSKDYKIDFNARTIDKIPRSVTVKDFMSKIMLPKEATARLLQLDRTTVVLEGKLSSVMLLEVTAEDGTVVYYYVNLDRNTDAYLKPGNYMINEANKTLSGVMQNMFYQDFLNSLILPEGAKASLYSSDHKTLVKSGFIANNMILRINAENIFTYREYKILTEPVKIKFGSKLLNSSISPVIINKTVYVPAEAFTKALGAKYNYDKMKSTISINKKNISIVMKISSTSVTVNNNIFAIKESPILMNGIPYVSSKFVSEILNYSYRFDEKMKTIEIK